MSLTLLLQRLDLIPAEKMLLEELLGAAQNGTYWQTLARARERNPQITPIILQNIKIKATMGQLVPILHQLRKDLEYDQEPDLRSDVPNHWQDAQK